MSAIKEKRNSKITNPVIGDRNRLRRKDDTPLREKLLNNISKRSQNSSYLTPVSRKQAETDLAQGHVRAIVDGNDEITAHVRCLPITDDISFIMTLHGTTREHVLEVLEYLAQDRTITLETVNKHLRDLGITENDLSSAGFERTSRIELGTAHLARTNLHYFNSDPLKFVKGFFQKDSNPEEYIVFVRRRKR